MLREFHPPEGGFSFGFGPDGGGYIQVVLIAGAVEVRFFTDLLKWWSDEVRALCRNNLPKLMGMAPLYFTPFTNLAEARYWLNERYLSGPADYPHPNRGGPIHILGSQARFVQPGVSFLEFMANFLEACPFYPRLFLWDIEGDANGGDRSFLAGLEDWVSSRGHSGLQFDVYSASDPQQLLEMAREVVRCLNALYGIEVRIIED